MVLLVVLVVAVICVGPEVTVEVIIIAELAGTAVNKVLAAIYLKKKSFATSVEVVL